MCGVHEYTCGACWCACARGREGHWGRSRVRTLLYACMCVETRKSSAHPPTPTARPPRPSPQQLCQGGTVTTPQAGLMMGRLMLLSTITALLVSGSAARVATTSVGNPPPRRALSPAPPTHPSPSLRCIAETRRERRYRHGYGYGYGHGHGYGYGHARVPTGRDARRRGPLPMRE